MGFRQAALTVPLLAVGLAACGQAERSHPAAVARSGAPAQTAGAPAPPARGFRLDSDEDNDNPQPRTSRFDGDDYAVTRFGHPAGVADRQAIVRLLKRYYAAAAAQDGSAACALLYPVLAEAVPEDYGQAVSVHGRKTCATVLARVLAPHRRELAADAASLTVLKVRLDGARGWAMLRLAMPSERRLQLHREGGAWRVDELLDTKLP